MGIFRRYDIRGVYGIDINDKIMRGIGKGFSFVCKDPLVVVSGDFRKSTPPLKEAFISGLSGKKIIDIGSVPISMALFAAFRRGATLAYVTASHLEKEWGGIKFYHADGIGYSEDEIQEIRKSSSEEIACSESVLQQEDVSAVIRDYTEMITSKATARRKMHLLIDCGNGAACVGILGVFKSAGFSADTIFDVPDGSFPNRPSDPLSDDLTVLRERMKCGAYDVGMAFDGDADRVMVVDDKGRKLTCEQMGYVSLHTLLSERPGPVAANVECSMLIDMAARKFGVEVLRFPVGHTFLSRIVKEKRPVYATEINGHGAVPHIAPFNDSIALVLYFVHALSRQDRRLSEIVDEVPGLRIARKNYSCDDSRKFRVIEGLKERLSAEYPDADVMDGIRVNLGDSWVLIRASNTEPKIRMNVEAKTEEETRRIMQRFGSVIENAIESETG